MATKVADDREMSKPAMCLVETVTCLMMDGRSFGEISCDVQPRQTAQETDRRIAPKVKRDTRNKGAE